MGRRLTVYKRAAVHGRPTAGRNMTDVEQKHPQFAFRKSSAVTRRWGGMPWKKCSDQRQPAIHIVAGTGAWRSELFCALGFARFAGSRIHCIAGQRRWSAIGHPFARRGLEQVQEMVKRLPSCRAIRSLRRMRPMHWQLRDLSCAWRRAGRRDPAGEGYRVKGGSSKNQVK